MLITTQDANNLAAALAKALGPQWSPELAAAWNSLYWLVAEAMQQGSNAMLFSH